jgi:hypothetical protein
MESKSGVRVPFNLTLSCMGKHFINLNLSSALFGHCKDGKVKELPHFTQYISCEFSISCDFFTAFNACVGTGIRDISWVQLKITPLLIFFSDNVNLR